MFITLNGKKREIPDNFSLLQLIEHVGQHPQRVAVEVNREIIRRPQYESHLLQDGDEVEILQFVGGGCY
ncbi:MAG: sulfur carrier protein ThiS [bacterium]|jgi:sulfur carrier protein